MKPNVSYVLDNRLYITLLMDYMYWTTDCITRRITHEPMYYVDITLLMGITHKAMYHMY